MTSSGLLDKAKAREDEVAVPVDDAELITAVEETTKDPIQTDVKTESAASDLKNPWFMIGIGMLAVSMVGLYFLKYIPGIAVLAWLGKGADPPTPASPRAFASRP